jgi:hypothetical protein
LVLILGAVQLLRRLWKWQPESVTRARFARALVVLMVALSAGKARHFVRHAWELYPKDPSPNERVEFRMPEWVRRNLPGARIMVTGSVRFWWDTQYDLAEVGGGSEQGVLNQYLVPGMWEITAGATPEMAVRWLMALGADAVIVPDQQSQEVYHDFVYPHKFASALPVLYDDHQGNVIYNVPRRYPSLARVVEQARVRTLHPLTPQNNLEALRAYTAVIEEGPASPATTTWVGTDRIRIHARVAEGQAVLAQVTYDPAWHAYSAGKPLAVHKDAAWMILIEAPPGEQDIELVFETPWENRIGWALTLISLALSGWLLADGGILRWQHHAR